MRGAMPNQQAVILLMRTVAQNVDIYKYLIVFPKVCKSQFYYFCNGNFKNDKLWNLHMNKSRK